MLLLPKGSAIKFDLKVFLGEDDVTDILGFSRHVDRPTNILVFLK